MKMNFPRTPGLLLMSLLLALVGAACTEIPPTSSDSEEREPGEGDTTDAQEQAHEAEPEPLAWGPTEDDVEAAAQRAGEFTDEELASIVIVPRYEGTGAVEPGRLVSEEGFG